MGFLDITTTTLPLIVVVVIGILTLFIPLLVGFAFSLPYWKNQQFTTAYSSIVQSLIIGILFFLFYDYLNDTAILGVNSLGSDPNAVLIIFLSLVCFLGVFVLSYLLDKQFSSAGILLVWALAIMLHSFGEGITIGDNLLVQGLTAIIFAFPIFSFILHKIIEGGISVMLFDNKYHPRITHVLILSIIAGLPPVFGVVLEYGKDQLGISSLGSLEIYVYSAALGAFFYTLPRFLSIKADLPALSSHRYAIWVIIGFLFMVIVAGIAHQIV